LKKVLPYLILLSALTISCCVAYYSVYGLSKVFSGASIAAITLMSCLEFSKLVIATSLHTYWNKLEILFKIFFTFALITLMVITSAGVYGFLSHAYEITASQNKYIEENIKILSVKKNRFEEQINDFDIEKNSIIPSIVELRTQLSNPNQVQYVDRKTGQIVTTSSSSGRKAVESQLQDAIERRNEISKKIESLTDSVSRLEIQIIEDENSNSAAAELGPLKYISRISGKSIDVVVNYFLILIVLISDPLAICLILLANKTGKFIKSPPRKEVEEVIPVKQDTAVKESETETVSTSPKLKQKPEEKVEIKINKTFDDTVREIEEEIQESKKRERDKFEPHQNFHR